MMTAGHKGTWLVIIIIIIINRSIKYSFFVYLHNNVLDKADRTAVIILLT